MTLPYASSTMSASELLTEEQRHRTAWTWSFSKYRQFKDCHERYRLKYLEQLKVPPLSQRPFFQGSVAHKLIEETREKMQKGEAADWSQAYHDLDGVFNRYAVSVDWRDDVEVERARLEAYAICENYITLLQDFDLGRGEVYCEHWFGTHDNPLVLESGLRLVGSIDWLKIDRTSNTAWIYDAKTSQGTQYLDRDQLRLYAIAVRKQFGVEIGKVGYLMLRWKRPLLYDLDLKELDRLEQQMCEASRQVVGGAMHAVPNMSLCGPCEYSSHCNPFKGWVVDGGTRQEAEW